MKLKLISALLLLCSSAHGSDLFIEEFLDGNLLLTSDIYQKLSSNTEGNFMVSIFVLEIVLAMVQSGCKDVAAHEIRWFMYLPSTKTNVEDALKTFIPFFSSNKNYTFDIIAKIYVTNNMAVNPNFRNDWVEAENLDFTDSDRAAKLINSWVEEKSSQTIHDLVTSSGLKNVTRSIIINALNFKASWSKPFSTNTSRSNFYKANKEVIQIETMYQEGYYNYSEHPDLRAKFLELPLVGEEASVIVILPNEKDGLPGLEDQAKRAFTPAYMSVEHVRVDLPKFFVECNLDLKSLLKELGIKRIFNENKGDLSGIAGNKGDLIVDEIFQKASIQFNEEGVASNAAAANVSGFPTSTTSPSESKEFNADHPFLFYVKIKKVIVFAGRVVDPRQKT